jgi:hypothetical protein
MSSWAMTKSKEEQMNYLKDYQNVIYVPGTVLQIG